MTRLIIIATPLTISAQLARLQDELRGVVKSGPPITDPITGLSYDQIRDICSGEYTGPLPEVKS